MSGPVVWMACLCASWCHICRDWQPQLEAWAAHQPGLTVVWVDIEDEADWFDPLGLDTETFPTVLLARGDQALFLGPVTPQVAGLGHLVSRLSDAARSGPSLPAAAHALAVALRTRLRPTAHTPPAAG